MLELQVVKNKMENEEGMNHLSVTVHPEIPNKEQNKVEKPVAFVLVLDSSGSMDENVGRTQNQNIHRPQLNQGFYQPAPFHNIPSVQSMSSFNPNSLNERNTKLQYVKQASEKLIDMMGEKDLLGVVSFANSSSLDYPLTSLTLENKHKIKDRIRALTTRGATNISAGLQTSFEQFTDEIKQNYHVKILLLSDGEANYGITEVDGISTLAKNFRKDGVSISTIGVGDSYNSFFMESIATASGAMFYHLKEMEQLEDIFSSELKSSLSLTTKDVYLTIDAPKGVHLSSNLNGFTEEKTGVIYVGNLYQPQQILLEFYTEEPIELGEKPIQVHAKYFNQSGSPKTISSSISVDFVKEEEMKDVIINQELAELVKTMIEAQTRKNSLRFYEARDMDVLQQNLDSNLNKMQKLSQSYHCDASTSINELNEFRSSVMNRSLDAESTKMMYSASYDITRNKSNKKPK